MEEETVLYMQWNTSVKEILLFAMIQMNLEYLIYKPDTWKILLSDNTYVESETVEWWLSWTGGSVGNGEVLVKGYKL